MHGNEVPSLRYPVVKNCSQTAREDGEEIQPCGRSRKVFTQVLQAHDLDNLTPNLRDLIKVVQQGGNRIIHLLAKEAQ